MYVCVSMCACVCVSMCACVCVCMCVCACVQHEAQLFDEIIAMHIPALSTSMKDMGVHPLMYVTPWFMCAMTSLPRCVPCCSRITILFLFLLLLLVVSVSMYTYKHIHNKYNICIIHTHTYTRAYIHITHIHTYKLILDGIRSWWCGIVWCLKGLPPCCVLR